MDGGLGGGVGEMVHQPDPHAVDRPHIQHAGGVLSSAGGFQQGQRQAGQGEDGLRGGGVGIGGGG